MIWKLLVSLAMVIGAPLARAQVATFAPNTAFLVTGVGAGGAVSAIALGVAAAPLAGLTAIAIAGYTLYVTQDQYEALLESGQLDKWQRYGLNEDLQAVAVSSHAEQMCRVRNSSGIGPAGLSYRRCVLDAVENEAGSAEATGTVTASLPRDVEEDYTSYTVYTAPAPKKPCPEDPNEPVTDSADNAIRSLYRRHNFLMVKAQDLHNIALEMGWTYTVKSGRGIIEYYDRNNQMRLALKTALDGPEAGHNSRRDRFEVRNADGNRYDLRTGKCLPESAPPGPDGDIWAARTHPALGNLRLLLERLKVPATRGSGGAGGVR